MASDDCRTDCSEKSTIRRDQFRGCCRHNTWRSPKICLRKHAAGCRHSRRDDEVVAKTTACNYNKFALAKRLHAENLQHQPLPDRVDDRVFRNVRDAHRCRPCSANREAKYQDEASALMRESRLKPMLGCKKPETRMDLAICWETPVDPVYEPRRPTHIDGSEGGSAPAIFALIQHTPMPRNRELLARAQKADNGGKCDCAGRAADSKKKDRCCCECLCDGMESVAVEEALPRSEKSRSNSVPPRLRSPRITERKCAACKTAEEEAERRHRDPRLTRSAVGIALGLDRKNDDIRRNGLPTRFTVPRPRTPFARRTFCIDTLAPPFSVVSGCRDADYPEHWRLMSVYQQSYKNPQKRRTRHF